LISKIGGDAFGATITDDLFDLGVNTDFIFIADAMNTGTIVTLVDQQGEDATCQCHGANNALHAGEIEQAEQVIAAATVCLIHGQLPQDAIRTALRLAEIHRTKVILTPVRPIEQNTQPHQDLPIEYFSAEILIANLQEAADISGQSADVRTAKLIGSDLVARGVHYAIITLGKRGCLLIDRHGADQISAFHIDLEDDSGCKDAFAGALAAYCAVKDNDMKTAVEFASAAGALACTKFGALDSMPSKAEIIQLLQQEGR
jgi:ribokinase